MKGFGFIILLVLMGFSTAAQNEAFGEPTILYSKQYQLGASMTTRGIGFNFIHGKYKDASHIRQLSLDLLFVKHEKETKNYFPDPNARSYFYGKQNAFYTLQPGYGRKVIFANKIRKNGVQLSRSWSLGPALGFTKPVYLEILYLDETTLGNYYIQVEKYNPTEHFSENIYGRASGFRGFGELKFHPGVFARYAFTFEYSNYNQGLKGIEVGANAQVFAQRIPIMADVILEATEGGAKNHQLFFSFYVNFCIGKKYDQL